MTDVPTSNLQRSVWPGCVWGAEPGSVSQTVRAGVAAADAEVVGVSGGWTERQEEEGL